MKVKKINPEWQPIENRGLKVGEVIEITDPRALIVNGDVVGVGEDGEELTALDLYDVITGSDKEEFLKFQAMKKQEGIKKHLEKEKEELEKQLEETKAVAAEKDITVLNEKPVDTKKVSPFKKGKK